LLYIMSFGINVDLFFPNVTLSGVTRHVCEYKDY
jgi:hypothetical protein